MDPTFAKLVGLAVLVLAAIAFFAVFRRRGKAVFKSILGEATLEGDNLGPSERVAPGVNATNAKAGRNLRAHSTATDGGISAVGAEADQDMILTHKPGGDAQKKP